MTKAHLICIALASASSIESDAHSHLPTRSIAKFESVFLQVQLADLEQSQLSMPSVDMLPDRGWQLPSRQFTSSAFVLSISDCKASLANGLKTRLKELTALWVTRDAKLQALEVLLLQGICHTCMGHSSTCYKSCQDA